jgi:putative Mg2+ transporter-C (MgtC) family protein
MQLIYEQLLKATLSVILSSIIGMEREKQHKPAGLRTHMLVCLGSTVLTMIAIDYFTGDSARILAGIVTGIGFIGAGAIIAQGESGIHGLTTAASLWIVAVIGMCIGIGWYLLAIVITLFIFLILFLGKFEHISSVKKKS